MPLEIRDLTSENKSLTKEGDSKTLDYTPKESSAISESNLESAPLVFSDTNSVTKDTEYPKSVRMPYTREPLHVGYEPRRGCEMYITVNNAEQEEAVLSGRWSYWDTVRDSMTMNRLKL